MIARPSPAGISADDILREIDALAPMNARFLLDRVCIVMMSAVGDAVHVLPVLNALKRHSPTSHITWVLQPGPATLVRGHRHVDEIVLFDRSKGWRAFTDMRRELATRQFDLVIDFQVYFKAGIVTSFTRAPVKLGFDRARARDFNWLFTTHRIPPHAPQHVQDQYFEFLTALGIPHEPVVWDLGPWPQRTRRGSASSSPDSNGPRASIVVATSKPQKDWLPERWAEVVDVLYARFRARSRCSWADAPIASSRRARDHGTRAAQAALRARQRLAQSRRHSRRLGARARAGHGSAAHGRRARTAR